MCGVEALVGQVDALTPAGIALMALVGLLVGVAPGSYPLLATAAGLAAARPDGAGPRRWRGLYLAAGFVLGIALVDALFGALFGAFGFLVLRILSPLMVYVYFALALLLVFLGLALLRVIRVNARLLYATPKAVSGFWAAFLLGIPFGLTTCPACTPLILPVLMGAATSGDIAMGAMLLFIFGLARGVPILVVGSAAGVLVRMHRIMFLVPRIERAGGILLLIAAAAFAYQGGVYARLLPPLFSGE
jgi:cytochrome c-type biogenesis protein